MALTALHVRGPFRGPSGYEHHVREFVRELDCQGVRIQLTDLPSWGPTKLPTHLRDPWFESLDRPIAARVALHFCMPHQVDPEPKQVNVNYTMFEATRIHRHWVAQNRTHALVIVPTESSRQAWVTSGVPADQVRLCPLGVNADLFSGIAPPLPLRLDNGQLLNQYAVRLLNVSELGPRKNLIGLLRVWIRATSPQDDAVLVVKLGCYAPGWREEFELRIEELERQLHKRLRDAAAVHFLYDVFSDAEMPRLYTAATHYISLSHGEGWDQAMVEAGASGLKLIAPNHSAYTAYLDPSVAQLISSREVPADFPGLTGLLFRGANWWEPDEDEAAAFVRSAIDRRDAGKASARPRIAAEFTWERATRRLISLLSEAEARRSWQRLWRRSPKYSHA